MDTSLFDAQLLSLMLSGSSPLETPSTEEMPLVVNRDWLTSQQREPVEIFLISSGTRWQSRLMFTTQWFSIGWYASRSRSELAFILISIKVLENVLRLLWHCWDRIIHDSLKVLFNLGNYPISRRLAWLSDGASPMEDAWFTSQWYLTSIWIPIWVLNFLSPIYAWAEIGKPSCSNKHRKLWPP